MLHVLCIGCGGFFGAISRYLLSGWVQERFGGGFPLGTLVVNVTGCLLLGAMMSLVDDHPLLSPNMRGFLAIGLLGAFTTFSTFGYETMALIRDQELMLAGGNILANVILGLVAVEAGRILVQLTHV